MYIWLTSNFSAALFLLCCLDFSIISLSEFMYKMAAFSWVSVNTHKRSSSSSMTLVAITPQSVMEGLKCQVNQGFCFNTSYITFITCICDSFVDKQKFYSTFYMFYTCNCVYRVICWQEKHLIVFIFKYTMVIILKQSFYFLSLFL